MAKTIEQFVDEGKFYGSVTEVEGSVARPEKFNALVWNSTDIDYSLGGFLLGELEKLKKRQRAFELSDWGTPELSDWHSKEILEIETRLSGLPSRAWPIRVAGNLKELGYVGSKVLTTGNWPAGYRALETGDISLIVFNMKSHYFPEPLQLDAIPGIHENLSELGLKTPPIVASNGVLYVDGKKLREVSTFDLKPVILAYGGSVGGDQK